MILRTEDTILRTPAVSSSEQLYWEVCCGEYQAPSLPCSQHEIQIEALDDCPVLFRRIGLGGGITIQTPQTLEIPWKTINTPSLASNLMHVHLALIKMVTLTMR